MEDKFRVVVADDERLIADNLAMNIERAHPAFQVVGIAHDGAEALGLAETLLPHVVFSDIKMPVMDGLTLFAALSQRRPEIRKVIVSGYDDFGFVREALKSRTFDYLLKPVNKAELRQTLEKLCAQLSAEHEELSAEASHSPGRIVETVQRHIRENYASTIQFTQLAEEYGFSGSYLARIFRERVGISPQRYLIDCRIVAAKRLLRDTELMVQEIGARVGYPDPFHFCKVFKQNAGVSPTQYRQTAAEETRE